MYSKISSICHHEININYNFLTKATADQIKLNYLKSFKCIKITARMCGSGWVRYKPSIEKHIINRCISNSLSSLKTLEINPKYVTGRWNGCGDVLSGILNHHKQLPINTLIWKNDTMNNWNIRHDSNRCEYFHFDLPNFY